MLCLAVIFRRIIEPAYVLLFNKPLYIHFYPIKRSITNEDENILVKHFKFYKKLSPRRKSYFRHRVAYFIDKCNFIGKNGLIVTREMKVKVAGTATMLTFGMRRYLPYGFSVIILYPDVFVSANGNLHKGEYNPAVGAVVFSWKHFEEGLLYDNNSINLGLHEFAHVIHINIQRRRKFDASHSVFIDMCNKIWQYLQIHKNREDFIQSGLLRNYAYANQFEFIAVLLEYFFETPDKLRHDFPKLYSYVSSMINYRE